MSITINLKYYEENHSVQANPAPWSCKAWKFPRAFIETLKEPFPEDIKKFDVCGVYLLLSKSSVYVGEAEQVISRLRQHTSKAFNWSVAIIFVTKEQAFEKSHIKYLEHEIYQKLKEANTYKIENTATPTRSHVGDKDTMNEYLRYITTLVNILGYEDLFCPAVGTAESIPPEQDVTIDDFIQNGIKAQDIARTALRYAIEKEFLSPKSVAALCLKENAKRFYTGGIPLLKVTDGKVADSKDPRGRARYNIQPVCFKKKKYLITHELYNTQDRDSRKALIEYLAECGLPPAKVLELCLQQKKTP